MSRTIHLCLLAVCLMLFARADAIVQIVTVGGTGNNFSPAYFTINPGDTVKWIWASGYHNTSSSTIPSGAVPWTVNIASNSTVYSYIPTVSGTYQYECTYHSGMYGQFTVNGCTNPQKPVITSINGPTACSGYSVKLRISSQTSASYQWIVGNTSIPFATADTLDATVSGSYKVVANRCGIDSVSSPFTVRIDTLPVPSFTYSSVGLSYAFINTTNPLADCNYSWTFSDGSPVQTTMNALHAFMTPGSYTVVLKATNIHTGCASGTAPVLLQANLGTRRILRDSITVYPLPANDVLYVTTDLNVSVHIADLTGRILSVPIRKNGNQYSFDTRYLPAGLYLLRLITTAGIEFRKVMILH